MESPSYVLKSYEGVFRRAKQKGEKKSSASGSRMDWFYTPFEIRFYGDYLIIYKENHYCNPRVSRMEFDKFFYADITKCQYKLKAQKINFYGTVECNWYDYNPDGSLPNEPTCKKTVRDGICPVYLGYKPYMSSEELVREIEEHSPIQVIVENS